MIYVVVVLVQPKQEQLAGALANEESLPRRVYVASMKEEDVLAGALQGDGSTVIEVEDAISEDMLKLSDVVLMGIETPDLPYDKLLDHAKKSAAARQQSRPSPLSRHVR